MCRCKDGAVIGIRHDMDCLPGLEATMHEAMRREEAVYSLNRRIGIGLKLQVVA